DRLRATRRRRLGASSQDRGQEPLFHFQTASACQRPLTTNHRSPPYSDGSGLLRRLSASPRFATTSVAVIATWPSSASARSPAAPCRNTASRQAASASRSWASHAAIMPVRTSPVPPVAIPALPVGLMY